MFINIHLLYRITVNRFILLLFFSFELNEPVCLCLYLHWHHTNYTMDSLSFRYFLIFFVFFLSLLWHLAVFLVSPYIYIHRNKDNGKMKMKMKNWTIFPCFTDILTLWHSHYSVCWCDFLKMWTTQNHKIGPYVCFQRINFTFNRLMRQQQRPMSKSHKMERNNTNHFYFSHISNWMDMCEVWQTRNKN